MKKLAGLLIFCVTAACGGGSGGDGENGNESVSSETWTYTVSGEIIGVPDGEYRIFFDRNNNRRQDEGEPYTDTLNGKYMLKGTAGDAFSSVVAFNTALAGGSSAVLETPAGESLISPVTTLVNGSMEIDGREKTAAVQDIISPAALGMSGDPFDKAFYTGLAQTKSEKLWEVIIKTVTAVDIPSSRDSALVTYAVLLDALGDISSDIGSGATADTIVNTMITNTAVNNAKAKPKPAYSPAAYASVRGYHFSHSSDFGSAVQIHQIGGGKFGGTDDFTPDSLSYNIGNLPGALKWNEPFSANADGSFNINGMRDYASHGDAVYDFVWQSVTSYDISGKSLYANPLHGGWQVNFSAGARLHIINQIKLPVKTDYNATGELIRDNFNDYFNGVREFSGSIYKNAYISYNWGDIGPKPDILEIRAMCADTSGQPVGCHSGSVYTANPYAVSYIKIGLDRVGNTFTLSYTDNAVYNPVEIFDNMPGRPVRGTFIEKNSDDYGRVYEMTGDNSEKIWAFYPYHTSGGFAVASQMPEYGEEYLFNETAAQNILDKMNAMP